MRSIKLSLEKEKSSMSKRALLLLLYPFFFVYPCCSSGEKKGKQENWATFLRNKRFTSRPISRVETAGSLVPPGVTLAVLAQHLGAYELGVNRCLHAEIVKTDAQVRPIKHLSVCVCVCLLCMYVCVCVYVCLYLYRYNLLIIAWFFSLHLFLIGVIQSQIRL
jgi:hypothetical protein